MRYNTVLLCKAVSIKVPYNYQIPIGTARASSAWEFFKPWSFCHLLPVSVRFLTKKTIVWLSPKISVLNRAGSSAPAFDNGAASNTAATPERTCPQSVRLSEGMQSDKFTLVGEKKEKRLKNRTSSREPANYSSHENLFSHFPSTHRQVRRPPDDRLRGPLLVRAGELQGPKPPRDLRLPPRRRRHRLQGGRIRRHGGADLPGGRTQRGGLHGHQALQGIMHYISRSHN